MFLEGSDVGDDGFGCCAAKLSGGPKVVRILSDTVEPPFKDGGTHVSTDVPKIRMKSGTRKYLLFSLMKVLPRPKNSNIIRQLAQPESRNPQVAQVQAFQESIRQLHTRQAGNPNTSPRLELHSQCRGA